MAEEHRHALETADQGHERAANLLARLISVASADKVYSEPVVAGETTIITAAEIRTGMGFGYGLATGGTVPAGGVTGSDANAGAASPAEDQPKGGIGPRAGGGGGGQAVGRPVAVITMGPDGVTVQPVLDRTRILLTALTALGAVALTLIRMRRAGRR